MEKKHRTNLTDEQLNKLADAFEEAKINSPFSTDFYAPKITVLDYQGKPREEFQREYVTKMDPKLFENLPEGWELDVSNVLGQRWTERNNAEKRQAIENITNPAIRSYIMQYFESNGRGIVKPAIADLSHLVELSRKVRESNNKPAYNPMPGSNMRLLLKNAVQYTQIHEAWSDDSDYVVPVRVEGDGPLNKNVAQINLNRFCESLRTHNGWAGSGCNWSATLMFWAGEPIVLLHCRASISE